METMGDILSMSVLLSLKPHLLRNSMTQFDSHSGASEDMNPKSLGITQPVILALDLHEHHLPLDLLRPSRPPSPFSTETNQALRHLSQHIPAP